MKLLVKLVFVLVVLVAVGVLALFLYVDSIAKSAIEKGGTYALGVETTLGSADVGILSGEFELSGLNVANPEGFDSPHFLHLDDGGTAVTLGSLREEVVELPHLTLTGLDMNLQRSGTDSNYKVILGNLKRLESDGDGGGGDAVEGGKRFVIRQLEIRDVDVHVNLLPVGGDMTAVDVPIDEIILTDVGSDSDKGVLLADLSSVIVKAIIGAALEKGGDLIPADLMGDLSSQLSQLSSLDDMGVEMISNVTDNLGEELTNVTDGLGDQVDEVTDGLGDKLNEGLGEGLGGLLGGDKKD